MVSGRPYTRHRAVKCPHMCPGATTAVAPNLPVLQLQCCYGHCCCQQKRLVSSINCCRFAQLLLQLLLQLWLQLLLQLLSQPAA